MTKNLRDLRREWALDAILSPICANQRTFLDFGSIFGRFWLHFGRLCSHFGSFFVLLGGEIWLFGLLGCCVVVLLCCWVVGLLSCWVVGFLG